MELLVDQVENQNSSGAYKKSSRYEMRAGKLTTVQCNLFTAKKAMCVSFWFLFSYHSLALLEAFVVIYKHVSIRTTSTLQLLGTY